MLQYGHQPPRYHVKTTGPFLSSSFKVTASFRAFFKVKLGALLPTFNAASKTPELATLEIPSAYICFFSSENLAAPA